MIRSNKPCALSDEQLISAPGEAWNYSGWGYSMLGAIIVKVIGEPFESYMHQRWLEALAWRIPTL
ncbi:MAG: serine hydrolase [Anaerolineae bacterium]|nr:serine hydrolase [Anaerolineae bacterium]